MLDQVPLVVDVAHGATYAAAPMFYKKLEHGFIRSLQRLMATGLTMVVVLQIWSPLRKL